MGNKMFAHVNTDICSLRSALADLAGPASLAALLPACFAPCGLSGSALKELAALSLPAKGRILIMHGRRKAPGRPSSALP